jgi:hypothetical protein
LVLTYRLSWSVGNSVADLDGGIYFLGKGRGANCNPFNNTYLYYDGNKAGATNSEFFEVSLGKAFSNGQWSGSTTIQLRAGWWGGSLIDYGTADITLSTKRVFNNGTSIPDNNPTTFGVDPVAVAVSTCAPLVKTANVSIDVGGRVTITVPK